MTADLHPGLAFDAEQLPEPIAPLVRIIELDHEISNSAVQRIQGLSWVQFCRLLTPLDGDSSMYEK